VRIKIRDCRGGIGRNGRKWFASVHRALRIGEDVIVQTEDGSYAANIEKAPVDALPAVKRDKKYENVTEIHTPNQKTIDEICTFLKVGAKELVKSLVYKSSDEIILVLVRETLK